MPHSTTTQFTTESPETPLSDTRIGYENADSQHQNGGFLTESITQSSVTSLDNVERNPALIYLAGLSESGRRSMAQKLRMVAGLLGYSDPRSVQWSDFRYEHLIAIRTKLSESHLLPP